MHTLITELAQATATRVHEVATTTRDDYVIERAATTGILPDATIAADVPPLYTDALPDHPQVIDWIRAYNTQPLGARWLYLTGDVGTGKTHQAYGAVRVCLTTSPRITRAGYVMPASWRVISAPELYATCRPRPGQDTKDELGKIMGVGLLVLDDLGAAKPSEWTEEINYLLLSHRYERQLPTIITSNLKPGQIAERIGERLASRLAQLCDVVRLSGPDRRRTSPAQAQTRHAVDVAAIITGRLGAARLRPVDALTDQVGRTIPAAAGPPGPVLNPTMRAACPFCGAARGERCRNTGNGQRLDRIHDARIQAAGSAS